MSGVSYPTSTNIFQVDGLSTDPPILGRHNRASDDLFPDVFKLCAKFNKSKDHTDLIHVRQVGLGISDLK